LRKNRLAALALRRALHEDVEHDTVLIDRPPKEVLLAANADEYLVQVPFVARPWPTPLQSIGKQPTEAQAPLADALIADHDASGRQDQLDVTQAEAEAILQPDRMLDDLDRVSEAAIRVGRGCDARQIVTALPRRQPDKADRDDPAHPAPAPPICLLRCHGTVSISVASRPRMTRYVGAYPAFRLAHRGVFDSEDLPGQWLGMGWTFFG
jgi:hypothetical protein